MIIDDRIVVMGSYNFTASAETKNDENLVVIDNPQIAAQLPRNSSESTRQPNRNFLLTPTTA
jgi:phosphatidylserine/phosphatidylglycerophosphate/cardiolipin synthase-like enzyme